MKKHFTVNFYQRARIDQQLENLSRVLVARIQLGRAKSFSERGRCYTAIAESLFQEIAFPRVLS